MAITVVSVVALVLSCVAIMISSVNTSVGKNDNEMKMPELAQKMISCNTSSVMNNDEVMRLDDDDVDKLLQDIEQELKTHDKDGSPEIVEINPVEAFQISTYASNNKAEVAIDGNEDTYMHTNRHTNPWWAADMGVNYHVAGVVVINRKISPSSSVSNVARARNLRVGVTNTRPVVGESLAVDAYTLCEEKPGLMGEVRIVSCPDEVSGQWWFSRWVSVWFS